MLLHRLQHGLILLEVEIADVGAHRGYEGLVVGVGFKLFELGFDAADIADMAEIEKFAHMFGAGTAQLRLDLRLRDRGLVEPQQRLQPVEKLADVERLRQRAVMRGILGPLRLHLAEIGREHDDRRAVAGLA